ncbi:GNAT family N-acetyltransferase [Chryseosolibacter indicus]|uniref:GNAT family N-acetyltransferase n=1 Tax=Chryseosolibacter indicus TaxID=2782351 RepID=A0ABS5VNG5_9BACT|nr:GNAT family N-acetyltransferase [Chryseosolibacter indicus]MBT1702380.1 GNAT family N-acetyltransferase [Chryseosolibacter indicus]
MQIRKAKREDVPFIVQLLADDKLGMLREDFRNPLPERYYQAFEKLDADANQELIVAVNDANEIIGTVQLTFIQGLSHQGALRAQVEGVRIREDHRGQGLGEELIRWVITKAKERKAFLLQLTTDKQRTEAIRFYQRSGFKATHEGMKLSLNV